MVAVPPVQLGDVGRLPSIGRVHRPLSSRRRMSVRGPEHLNPRSHAVIELRRSLERAPLLRDLCHEHWCRWGEDAYAARHDSPAWGMTRWKFVDRKGFIGTGVRQLFPHSRDWKELWPFYFDQWRSGSLDRQIADLAANLPPSVREKLGV